MGGLWWLIFLGLGGAGDRLVLICLMFLRSFEYVIQYIARADKGGALFAWFALKILKWFGMYN